MLDAGSRPRLVDSQRGHAQVAVVVQCLRDEALQGRIGEGVLPSAGALHDAIDSRQQRGRTGGCHRRGGPLASGRHGCASAQRE